MRARYTAVYDVLIYRWSAKNSFIIWDRILLIMIAMGLCDPLDMSQRNVLRWRFMLCLIVFLLVI